VANQRKKSKKRKKPKNQNHPALIGMKRIKKRTLFDEKHQVIPVKNKTNTTKKKFMALF